MRVRTTCNRDCPDACGIVATVDGDRVVKIQGDPDHPVTRGFLCYRTSRFLERQYDPDRIRTPLERDGRSFRSIGWERALDRVAQTMLRIREESGAAAILNYRSGGSLGLMKHVTDFFFERFGPVTIKSGDICSGAGDAAQFTDFGDEDSNDLDDLLHSKNILVWGKNPFVSNVHLLPFLREAKRRGTRLVQIDPVHHRGAELCDLFLQPRPGGDIALGMALIRWLFDNQRTDPAAADYCDHLDRLRDAARTRTIDEWAALADLPPESVTQLAEIYADGPSTILVGWGMQRRARGSQTVRVLDALGAVSGNIGVCGGGVSFYFKRRGAFDLSFQRGLAVAPRAIPEPLLGPGILEASDPPVRMVWVSNGNPVAMLPDSATVAEALRTRELTVVVDSFLTDTACEADLILPTTTMLEDDDLVGAYGHHLLGIVRPVVPAPDEVKTDYEIVQALASRVGIDGEFRWSVAEWKRRLLSPVAPHGVTLEALEQGPRRNPLSPPVVFADRKFDTPSGRVNLVHEIDAAPPRGTDDRPLLLTALATERAQASQSPASKRRGLATVTVHPDVVPGLEEGCTVRIESDIGSIQAVLRLDDRQRTDVALIPKGGWMRDGRCANVLVPARQTDAGGGAVYYDTPVRIVPASDAVATGAI